MANLVLPIDIYSLIIEQLRLDSDDDTWNSFGSALSAINTLARVCHATSALVRAQSVAIADSFTLTISDNAEPCISTSALPNGTKHGITTISEFDRHSGNTSFHVRYALGRAHEWKYTDIQTGRADRYDTPSITWGRVGGHVTVNNNLFNDMDNDDIEITAYFDGKLCAIDASGNMRVGGTSPCVAVHVGLPTGWHIDGKFNLAAVESWLDTLDLGTPTVSEYRMLPPWWREELLSVDPALMYLAYEH